MSRTRRLYDWLDDRLELGESSSFLGKAFPAEDSFLLGEIALFCFALLGLSGIFLGFFYEPSTTNTLYEGSVAQFQGEELPAAFTSVLQITYDVPFGMFIRRVHHWAAHLFIASIGLHMLRVYFTGAYRNPRELNWMVGVLLAIFAMGAAYTGYALPFDEFAATATGIGYNMASSIPILGGAISKIIFGGSFPSSATIPRLYFLHVLVIPVLLAGVLAVHMFILIRQKHTEAARDEDIDAVAGGDPQAGNSPAAAADGGKGQHVDHNDDSVVVGLPAFPNQVAVSAVVFFLTAATLALLAGFLPVHNIAEYGPNNPATTPDLIMPDWFLMWLYGFLKLWPTWLSFDIGPLHFSTEFLGGIVVPTLVFLVVFAWPFIDRNEPIHFTTDPLDRAWQTGVGVAGVTFIMVASIAGMNNLLADAVGISTQVLNPLLIVALLVVPLLAFGIVYGTLRDSSDEATAGSSEEGDGSAETDKAEEGNDG